MNNITFQCNHLDDLDSIALKICNHIKDEKIIAFYGEMGAGKTTLVKSLCRQLGVTGNISSPTFSLVNEYECENGDLIYHFDFYRIKNISEVYDMGYENYFESGNKCFIEWPDKIEPLLDFPHTKIFITVGNDVRKIEVQNYKV